MPDDQVACLAGHRGRQRHAENALRSPDVLPGVTVRPADITSCQCQRPTLLDCEQKAQATVSHDELATVLDPHLRLGLDGYVWPFLLIATRPGSRLGSHVSILPAGEDEAIVEQITQTLTALLTALIFAAAVLYSSVGHAGASGYLAAMALCGVAPEVMKPTALTLNIAVALITTARFYRAGHFSWSLSWPFIVSSVPLAFVGGAITCRGRSTGS